MLSVFEFYTTARANGIEGAAPIGAESEPLIFTNLQVADVFVLTGHTKPKRDDESASEYNARRRYTLAVVLSVNAAQRCAVAATLHPTASEFLFVNLELSAVENGIEEILRPKVDCAAPTLQCVVKVH